jgi:lipoprotein-anchoring transpeptidase ErfK/SrfK
VPLADGGFLRTRELHLPIGGARPTGVGAKERWVDVDVSEQTLVAYEGDQPVYATLVSTGRPGRNLATPIGEFRIWVKLAFSDMDDLERDDLESNYAIERVPWVQYFEKENGLHAAFWHDDFGRRRSHGCVNLAPRDARFLFDFTSPRLPDGYQAVFPTTDDPGTLVRIRE